MSTQELKERILDLEIRLENEQKERKRLEALHVATVRAISGNPPRPPPLAIMEIHFNKAGVLNCVDLGLVVRNEANGDVDRQSSRTYVLVNRFLRAGYHRLYLYPEE